MIRLGKPGPWVQIPASPKIFSDEKLSVYFFVGKREGEHMRTKVLSLVFLIVFICASVSFAAWDKKPVLRFKQLYHYDTRHSGHRIISERVSSAFNYLDEENRPLLVLTPFFEICRNIEKDVWNRKEIGSEIGKDIVPWFYIGESLQYVWLNEDYRWYGVYEKRSYAEAETRLVFSHNLIKTKFITINGFAFEEYTYDFNEGEAIRNEVAGGIIIPVNKNIETEITWRHIDPIHYYDMDSVEASVTFVF